MRARPPLNLVLGLLCVVLVGAAFSQARQVAAFRGEQQRLLVQVAAVQGPLPKVAAPPPDLAGAPHSSELLQLRNEVSRLVRRKHELAAALPENERLRIQLAAAATNRSAGLPSGYLRKANAQNVGYATPEATLQTFLWAIKNKNLNAFLETLLPENAQLFQQELQRSGRSWDQFADFREMPGLRILQIEQTVPGHLDAQVEVVPGTEPIGIQFQQINGLWKMQMPH